MTSSKLPAPPPASSGLVEKDTVSLQRAVEKLLLFGQQVGVTPEQVISLLDTGCDVRDLLAVLASKNSGAA